MADENVSPAARAGASMPPPATRRPPARGRKKEEEEPTTAGGLRLDDDDDDDDDDVIIVGRPQPSGLPPPSIGALRAAASTQGKKVADEFENLLTSLDFSDMQHSITVHRELPEFDPDEPTKRIAGYLEKFTKKIDPDILREKFGGGTYRLYVTGPDPTNPNRIIPKANKSFTVSQEHAIVRRPVPKGKEKEGMPEGVAAIVNAAMQSSDKQMERLSRESERGQKLVEAMLTKGDGGMKEMLLALNNPQQTQAMLAAERQLTEQRFQKEREDRRIELAAAEQRHKDEREDRRNEAAAAERRHNAELLATKEENARVREDANRRHELALKAMEKSEGEKAERQAENMKFMASMQQMQVAQMEKSSLMTIQMMQGMATMEREFLLKQVELLGRKDDPIQKIVEMKKAMDVLSGADKDEGAPTWERIVDKVQEGAPGLLAAVAGFRGTQTEPNKRVLPGSIVSAPLEDVEPDTAVATTEKVTATVSDVKKPTRNVLAEYIFPSPDTAIPDGLEMLVKDIDLALQRDKSVDAILDDIVTKFPPIYLTALRELTAEMLILQIGERVPDTWRINSLDGQRKVRELRSRLG